MYTSTNIIQREFKIKSQITLKLISPLILQCLSCFLLSLNYYQVTTMLYNFSPSHTISHHLPPSPTMSQLLHNPTSTPCRDKRMQFQSLCKRRILYRWSQLLHLSMYCWIRWRQLRNRCVCVCILLILFKITSIQHRSFKFNLTSS